MTSSQSHYVGFTCAYTPLPLIHAAGLTPYRVLPITDAPDQAGQVLHDNICPHVKRVLDRAQADELPPLTGMVIMDSCDAMRRLADAWRAIRSSDPVALIDLPTDASGPSIAFLAGALDQLSEDLAAWSGRAVSLESLTASVKAYDVLATHLKRLIERAGRGQLPGGRLALQRLLNRSVTAPLDAVMTELAELEAVTTAAESPPAGVPVFLFGNVLPDPEAFALLEQCGAHVAGDDLCTGSRQLAPFAVTDLPATRDELLTVLARSVLERPSCARTLGVADSVALAKRLAAQAQACGAQGVIAHVMKFCDPYLARMPVVQGVLREASLPLLVLEGDCTLRSLGQHRTRIEAFVEMMGEAAS